MSVQPGPTEKRYAANGVSLIYTVPFLVIEAGDLQVLLNGSLITSGFTHVGVGLPISYIEFTLPPAGDLLLQLNVPFQRPVDYQENGDFLSSTVNRDFDRIWQALKQLLRTTSRSPVLGINDIDGQGFYRAKGNGLIDLASAGGNPTAAANWKDVLDYVASILETGQGPVNNAANVVYLDPDGVARTVQDLSGANGAAYLGRGSGTVEDAFQTIEGRATNIENELAEAPGELSVLAREARVNELTSFVSSRARFVSKSLATTTYDHFGVMDVDSMGGVYMFFRRGTTHMADAGRIVFTRMQSNGQWSTPATVLQVPNMDYAGNAGGTMRNGRIVIATNSRTIPGLVYQNIEILVSDDYGVTWTKKGEIPLGAYGYKFTYGQGVQVGNKYLMTYYCQIGTGVVEVRTIESSDGGETWQDGVLVASGLSNETALCNLGGGYVLAVSRIGPGNTGKMRQHLSSDGGQTWTDQGDVSPEIAEGVVTLVSPALSYFISESGTPFVLLTYTDRTADRMVYRTCRVSRVIAGVDGWSERVEVYSAPNASGYQTTVVLPNRQIIGNLFREDVADSISQANQFEIRPGDLPDYESLLTGVSALGNYVLPHGLPGKPKRVEIMFSPDATGATTFKMTPMITVISGTPVGSGAQVQVTASGISIGTGTYVWGSGAFGTIDNTSATRYTAGYYRVRAWI